MQQKLRVGVIGLGFMGRTHVAGYQSAAQAGLPVSLVAVADARVHEILAGSSGGGNLSTAGTTGPLVADSVRRYAAAAELIADADVDAISLCTPTDTHVELSLAILRAGKHLLLEKPVAVASADVERLRDAARDNGRVCMPAMVMRFWPGWEWLADRIRDANLGPLRSLELERRGSRPTWNAFYHDDARSGGALVDLHIHDSDFVFSCFGMPSAVTSVGSLNQVTTLYHYPTSQANPSLVVASGGWGQSPGFGFRMRYLANFERATADFDLSRGDRPVLLSDDRSSEPLELPLLSGYDAEIRHFVEVVAGRARPRATLDDAVAVARLLEAERRSLESGGTVRL